MPEPSNPTPTDDLSAAPAAPEGGGDTAVADPNQPAATQPKGRQLTSPVELQSLLRGNFGRKQTAAAIDKADGTTPTPKGTPDPTPEPEPTPEPTDPPAGDGTPPADPPAPAAPNIDTMSIEELREYARKETDQNANAQTLIGKHSQTIAEKQAEIDKATGAREALEQLKTEPAAPAAPRQLTEKDRYLAMTPDDFAAELVGTTEEVEGDDGYKTTKAVPPKNPRQAVAAVALAGAAVNFREEMNELFGIDVRNPDDVAEFKEMMGATRQQKAVDALTDEILLHEWPADHPVRSDPERLQALNSDVRPDVAALVAGNFKECSENSLKFVAPGVMNEFWDNYDKKKSANAQDGSANGRSQGSVAEGAGSPAGSVEAAPAAAAVRPSRATGNPPPKQAPTGRENARALFSQIGVTRKKK